MPILAELPVQPPEPMGWQAPADMPALVDMLAPPAGLLDLSWQARLAKADQPLRGAYLVPGWPPYSPSLCVVAPAADVRAAAWLAYKSRLAGLLIDDVLDWRGNPLDAGDGGASGLFYPGSVAGLQEVLPSVRLKRLRRGLQDLAYLWLLQQRGQPGIAQTASDCLARYAASAAAGDNYLDARLDGWSSAPADWELARRLLGQEAQALDSPRRRREPKPAGPAAGVGAL